jgi:hypothetical protein
VHALAAFEARDAGDGGADGVGGVVWVEDVEALAGVVLGAAVWGKDLDGVVDSGGGDGWFVGMTWIISKRQVLGDLVLAGEMLELTLDDVDYLAVAREDVDQVGRLPVPKEEVA